MKTVGVIPLRMGSKRFPGKALHKIKGRPLAEWVYNGAKRSRMLDKLIIATDDKKIAEFAESIGAECVISDKKHSCGSERVAEAVAKYKPKIVVNIQGDEIGADAELIRLSIKAVEGDKYAWAGTVARLLKAKEIENNDNVKVVVDNWKRALYFSRCPIPCKADGVKGRVEYYGHVGVYAFRYKFLQKFAELKPTPLEKAEKLEQLRILEHGGIISVAFTKNDYISINRKSDIKTAEGKLKLQDN